jgi:diaminopimelate epimerase
MLSFIKASALGNDFVLVPGPYPFKSSADFAYASKILSNRRFGIGCDQVIFFNQCGENIASALFFNSDGSESFACGNGTRALAFWFMTQLQTSSFTIRTKAGDLACAKEKDRICVTCAKGNSPCSVEIDGARGFYVDIGNPHFVYFDQNLDSILEKGPLYSTALFKKDSSFPENVNVEVVAFEDSRTLHMRVFERGAGVTPSCGSGAIAAYKAAQVYYDADHSKIEQYICINQLGGQLFVEAKENSINLIGDAKIVFSGTFPIAALL